MKLEELARAVAKADFEAQQRAGEFPGTWENASPARQRFWVVDTTNTLRALLAVLPSVGWALAPVEATDEQRAAMSRLNHPRDAEIYAAGVAAAPKLED